MLAFYYDNPSSNPSESTILFCQIVWKNENLRKRGSGRPFEKKTSLNLFSADHEIVLWSWVSFSLLVEAKVSAIGDISLNLALELIIDGYGWKTTL